MIKDTYIKMNEKVNPDPALIYRSLSAAEGTPRRTAKPAYKRPALICTILLVCLLLATPVLAAAGVDAAYEVLYTLSPSAAQYFKPVALSCEANGIQMEVSAVYIHEDTAEIYISLRDLTEHRIDETTDLFDSYSIRSPFSSTGSCRLVEYDEDTDTATFLTTITQWDKESIRGDKLTLSLRHFLSGKQEFEGEIAEIDLSQASLTPRTQAIEALRGGSGRGFDSIPEHPTALLSGGAICSPANGVEITAVGFIDGQLHVQAHYADILSTDNHGSLSLSDGRECLYTVSFWDGERTGSFEEYVFDISPEELEGAALCGSFTTTSTLVEGPWQLTFPLTDTEQ